MKKALFYLMFCSTMALFIGCPEDDIKPPPACVEGTDYTKETLMLGTISLPYAASTLEYQELYELNQYHNYMFASGGAPIWSLMDITNSSSIGLTGDARPYIKITEAITSCRVPSIEIYPADNARVSVGQITDVPYVLNITGLTSRITIATAKVSSGGRFIWSGSFTRNHPLSLGTSFWQTGTRGGGGNGAVDTEDDNLVSQNDVRYGFFTFDDDLSSLGSGGSGGVIIGTIIPTDDEEEGDDDEDNEGGVVIITPEIAEGWTLIPNTSTSATIPDKVIFRVGTVLEPIRNPSLTRDVYVGDKFDSNVMYNMPLQIVEPKINNQ